MRLLSLLLAAAVVVPSAAQVTGYEAYANWADIARLQPYQAYLSSSYDRTGGNNDYNYYISPTGEVKTVGTWAVAAQYTGAGVLNRMWMPHGIANLNVPLRLTIDGSTVISTDSKTLFGGGVAGLSAPMLKTLVGGQVCYEPIGFTQSLKIEVGNRGDGANYQMRNYYQFNVQVFTAPTAVEAYTGTLSANQQSKRQQAVAILNNPGVSPFGQMGTGSHSATAGIAAGQSMSVFSMQGQGTIQRLGLQLGQLPDATLDSLRLRVRYDSQSDYAIDVPVSDFFGVGHGRADYKSLPLGKTDDGELYCYWPMPFRQGVSVELYNAGSTAVNVPQAQVQYSTDPVGAFASYLHAQYNVETTTAHQASHLMLSATGQGKYVGSMLWFVRNSTSKAPLEGDDVVRVDGGTNVLYGTGMEDAYNGGFYYNHVWESGSPGEAGDPPSGTSALYGLLNFEDTDLGASNTRVDQYRWLIADAVPFNRDIQVTMEDYGTLGGIQYGSTAFYYLLPKTPGDTNGDGRCDFNDYLVLEAAFGTSGASPADLDGNGSVDFADYLMLESAFGSDYTVPEPASLVILTAGAGLLVRRRRVRV